jgi:hypothetical protein
MRRALIPFLILTFFLSACGTLEVTLTSSRDLTQTPVSASPTAEQAPLSMDSTSDEIRQRLVECPFHWQTIFMDAHAVTGGESPRRVQAWVDQSALSLRVLSGPSDGDAETLRVADRMSLLDLNIQTGQSKLSPFLENSQVPYTPQAPGPYPVNSIAPHPLEASIDPDLGVLIFPDGIAQNEGTFQPIAMEVIAYRLALVVEWTYIQNTMPSYRAWVDISTGVFLRYQQFEKSGGSIVLSEVSANRVDYDLPYPADLFSVSIAAMPNFAADPQAPSVATATPAPAPVSESLDPLGMVYSFVADNSYPVRAMRLVRLPASCAIGKSDCPSPEVIKMPVALTSSLQPLVWSPARREAAWAYPVNADQRIWTLYLFNSQDNAWSELASFDRYMDPPTWSHDGAWLAFRLQDGNGNSEIYAIRRDGTDMKILTASDKLPADGQPYVMDSWLGESVVLRSGKPGASGTIYLMRIEDGVVKPLFDTLLTKSPFLESPDGTMLAYVDYDYNSQKQRVKTLTPDGKTFQDIAAFASGSILGLTWSPDGKQLAFVQRTDPASTLYVIDSDGRNMRQVYTSATDVQFVFSPDGKYLLAQTIDGTGEHLYSIKLSTLEAHLVQAPGIALNEAWMFPSWRE